MSLTHWMGKHQKFSFCASLRTKIPARTLNVLPILVKSSLNSRILKKSSMLPFQMKYMTFSENKTCEKLLYKVYYLYVNVFSF